MKIKNLLFLSIIFLSLCRIQPVKAQNWQVLKDVWPGIGNSSSTYNWMTEANGKLFFSALDETHGMELWVSDGTENGTTLLKDIFPGATWSEAGWAGNFAVCNNMLFFIAKDGIHGSELWATDGTESGTYLVKDIGNDTEVGIIWSGLNYGGSGVLYTFNNKVYFPACDGRTSVGQHDTELWCSDGTEEGTYMVKDIRPDEGSTPKQFCEFNGLLYFEAYDGAQGQGGHGGELWVTDGTETGTHLFKDIAAVASSEHPQSLTVCDDQMFFTTDDGIHGKELWVTDGTDAGTHLVKDIRTDGAGSYPDYLTTLNGILYFRAAENNGPRNLWRSDGTEAGTYKVTTDLYDAVNLKVYNDKLYFLASDITGGSGIGNYELWSWTETSGVTLVKEINPDPNFGIDFNPGSNFPEGFVEYNNLLYFRAADDGYGTRLWQTDGTANGTIETPGPVSSYPDPLSPMYFNNFNFHAYNGSLYYPGGYADDPAIEVYKLTTVLVYSVTGGGYYCDGMEGLPVGLSGSNEGITYTLYKNDIAQSPAIIGTGEAISFGNQLFGTYTIKATDASGITINMNGNAVINEGTLPVSVTALPDQNGVCTGTTITFTATPFNGGTPVYQWYKNNEPVGANQNTYVFIPEDNDSVYVQLTSSLGCVSGNPALSDVTVMSVSNSLVPGVTITSDYDTICGGSTVQYYAEPVNGGTTPSYQWFKNNEPVGANQPAYSYVTPWVNEITQDSVYVVMTSNLTCAVDNPVTSSVDILTVLPRPFVNVSIEADNEVVIAGSPVTITAIPVNGGTSPTYYWNVNDNPVSTTNEPSFTYVPAPNDFVYVMMNSNLPCTMNDPATSNYIYITVITSANSNGINDFKVFCYNKVLTIENSRECISEVSIFDLTGRELVTHTLVNETKALIPVTNLTRGIYLVKVTSNKNQFSTKVLID